VDASVTTTISLTTFSRVAGPADAARAGAPWRATVLSTAHRQAPQPLTTSSLHMAATTDMVARQSVLVP
jgi:hypothetical protein